MNNLIYQSLAVGFKTVVVFLFFYLVNRDLSTLETSIIISEFTFASILSVIICFGFDYSFIQESKLKIDLNSFIIKITIGIIISVIIILIQKLNFYILFYAISLAFALMFKGYIRFSKKHKLDCIVNLITLFLFCNIVFFLNVETSKYLLALSFCFFIIHGIALFWQMKFTRHFHLDNIINSVSSSAPLMFYGLISYLLLNIDVYFFDYLDKLESYSAFAISNKFFMNLTMVAAVLSNYRISSIFKSNNDDRFLKEFILLGFLLSIFTYLFSDKILLILLSGEIVLNKIEILIFSIIVLIRCINTYYSVKILQLINNWKRLYIMLTTVTVHCIFLFILIEKFDWQGALYSNLLSILLLTAINYYFVKTSKK